MMVSDFI